jgi:ubiquinone/menaquinone biosynthesis C-methylase UbiE
LSNDAPHQAHPRTRGKLIHQARAYDALVWILFLGRTRKFYSQVLDIANVKRGQSVLDVGCGTGSLAIAASERVGPEAKVHGIDASPEMIERARNKAAKRRSGATFTEAVVEEMPFPDAQFDVVLCTMMLHHLPRSAREQCAREMRRVLKPGGSAMVVEFGRDGKSFIERLHRHGALKLSHIHELLESAGFVVGESGAVEAQALNFIRATAPD